VTVAEIAPAQTIQAENEVQNIAPCPGFDDPAEENPKPEGDPAMRFLGLLKADKYSEAGVPPSKELMEKMGRFIEEVTQAGVLVGGAGLQPSSKGARVRLSGGKVTVTDGPFTETKEVVASYALLETKSMAEAIQWTTRFLHVLGQGECELCPLEEPGDFGEEGPTSSPPPGS
jgi:hypothetical protein